MTIQELNTLHHIAELERAQLPTILAMSFQSPQLVCYILPGNCSNFPYVEKSTAWLFVCPQFPSPLYGSDNYFGFVPNYNRDTVMYSDSITRQTINYPTPFSCNNKPQKVMRLKI